MRNVRWKGACINWGHPDAPHAISYALIDGHMRGSMYHDTWAQAMERATRYAGGNLPLAA